MPPGPLPGPARLCHNIPYALVAQIRVPTQTAGCPETCPWPGSKPALSLLGQYEKVLYFLALLPISCEKGSQGPRVPGFQDPRVCFLKALSALLTCYRFPLCLFYSTFGFQPKSKSLSLSKSGSKLASGNVILTPISIAISIPIPIWNLNFHETRRLSILVYPIHLFQINPKPLHL